MVYFIFICGLWMVWAVSRCFEKRNFGYAFGPMATMLFMFALGPTVFFAPIVTIMMPEPSLFSCVVYFFAVFMCLLGYISGFILRGRIIVRPPLPFKFYHYLLVLSICFALVSFTQSIHELVKFGFFSSGVSGAEAYNAMALFSEESGGSWSFALSTLTGSFKDISGFCVVVLLIFYRTRYSQMMRIFGWSVAALWALVLLSSLSRGALIYPILTSLGIAYNFSRRLPWAKLIKGATAVIIILIVLTFFRHESDHFYGRSYSHNGVAVHLPFWYPNMLTWIAETVIFYLGHPIGNFGILMDGRSDLKISYGYESIRGSFFFLRVFSPDSFYSFAVENAQNNSLVRARLGIARQWATWMGSLYLSFGLIGLYLSMFASGYLFTAVQRFAKSEGGGIERIFFAALMLVAFSAPAGFFMGGVAGFGLFVFVCLIYLWVSKVRHF